MPEGNRRYTYVGTPFSRVSEHLTGLMSRFVLDKTGLDGGYSFTLFFAFDDSTPGAAGFGPGPAATLKGDGPSIFAAFDALGLKLEKTTGPAEYIQIDSVQKPRPNSPNPSTHR
jgi:uncharacterized protein (TIGR03435 family)